MSFKVYIPARFASTRLPGKPLLVVAGHCLLEYVYRQAKASGATDVVIATDDARIADVARGFGADVCMTATEHQSGTDRIAEAVAIRGEASDTVIVNVQGDEPGMAPAVIRQAAGIVVEDVRTDIGTVCEPLLTEADWRDPNQVKVIRDVHDRALYFSRAPLPFAREPADPWTGGRDHRRHVGIYAYRAGFLQRFVALPPHPLELAERLEQLRALANGACIRVPDARAPCGIGIDTPADLARFEAAMRGATATP
ncbi:MAG: 3-deoxy-manno-octulosonate cytidylyltransferase [Gammaproteobacteria bacterium]